MRLKPLLPGMFVFTFVSGLAEAAPLGGGHSPDINLIRIGLSLVLCLVIAAFAILMLRRKSAALPWLALARPADAQAITVKETRRISVHAEVCRFECGGQEYLVIVTSQGATLLRERQIAPMAPS